jgi:hypothetical protein
MLISCYYNNLTTISVNLFLGVCCEQRQPSTLNQVCCRANSYFEIATAHTGSLENILHMSSPNDAIVIHRQLLCISAQCISKDSILWQCNLLAIHHQFNLA